MAVCVAPAMCLAALALLYSYIVYLTLTFLILTGMQECILYCQ